MPELIKVTVWYSIQNYGDGSCGPKWFLTEKAALDDQDNLSEGWGEPCYGKVETYSGSNVHKEALQNE